MHAGVHNRRGVLLVLSCVIGLAPALVHAQTYPRLSRSDLKTLQGSFAEVADNVLPSVVAIRTYIGSEGLGDRGFLKSLSQGSGVIFRSNGFILTNFHVVEGATHIIAILHDGREHDAALVQADVRSDLAVLRIDGEHFKAARFGKLEDIRIGHWTFAVGNPFGLANFTGGASFSVGNVSSFGRNLTDLLDVTDTRYYGNLIETSAAINPGNSGGPLFNIDGEVIGVVTAIETRTGVTEGVGFAIPISERTHKIIASLERGEQVRYGYMGVRVDKEPPRKRHDVLGVTVSGARMGEVLEGPAAQAGLRDGDVVIELDGVPIRDYDHLVRVVGGAPVGTAVKARYVRKGRERTATVILGERPIASRVANGLESDRQVDAENWRGAVCAEVSPGLRSELKLDAGARGILILDVVPASDAAIRGLRRLDIVTAVNGEPVGDLDQFRRVRQRATDAIRLTLTGGKTINFVLPAPSHQVTSR